ncbi:MAG TPA: hypothetical protein VE891_06005 [Allosphingosinicella sp.]|nr:hypothetical protein [Allosphingosinicella sp.]
MKTLALAALFAAAATAAPALAIPLQALSEADVGADALRKAACYAHDGPAVLLLATKKNAIVNDEGDLRLLRRLGGRGLPDDGARYGGSGFEIRISPVPETAGRRDPSGRRTQPAKIRIVRGKSAEDFSARWSCGAV